MGPCNCIIGLEEPAWRNDMYPKEYYISDYLNSFRQNRTTLIREYDYCQDCGQKIALPSIVASYNDGVICDATKRNGRYDLGIGRKCVSGVEARRINAECIVICTDVTKFPVAWYDDNLRIVEWNGKLIGFDWVDERTEWKLRLELET